MKTRQPKRSVKGFTLIELLVVITIIGILAGLLIPVVLNAIQAGQMTQVMSNGRSIYQALLADAFDGESRFPRSSGPGSYDNSTDYWKWVVTNRVVDVTFSFFTAPGLPSYHGLDSASFTPDHNAWCITADVTEGSRNDVPLLFTRNLNIRRVDEPAREHLTIEPPFGQDGLVLVTKGGSAVVLQADDLNERFNPVSASNTVLRPAP